VVSDCECGKNLRAKIYVLFFRVRFVFFFFSHFRWSEFSRIILGASFFFFFFFSFFRSEFSRIMLDTFFFFFFFRVRNCDIFCFFRPMTFIRMLNVCMLFCFVFIISRPAHITQMENESGNQITVGWVLLREKHGDD